MSGDPVVSVIIPYYNRAAIIGRTIASVQGQTFSDWELIIVDDGSDDQAALVQAAIGDVRIRLIRHARNLGVSAARNTGVAAASGRFVAFLDSDDEWLPRKLESQLTAVYAAPDPENVFCSTRTIVVLSEHISCIRPRGDPAPGRSLAQFLYIDGGFAQSSSFFLSTALARRCPFCEALPFLEDHMFFIEMGARATAYVLIREPLTIWHNEKRSDRITSGDELLKLEANFRTFIEKAAKYMSPLVLQAAEARYLSGLLWKKAPAKSLRLVLQARRKGALSTREMAALLCRNAMPAHIYDVIRLCWDQALRRSPDTNRTPIWRPSRQN
jgi:hypothetical protein